MYSILYNLNKTVVLEGSLLRTTGAAELKQFNYYDLSAR